MNENVLLGVGLIVGVIAVAALLYNAVRGVHGSLSTAKVGEVYNFEYEQPYHGEHKRVLAKVIEPVYELSDNRIKTLNRSSGYRRNDPVFQRTKHLVTCEMPNGEVRQFYTERASNVRRCLLGNKLFRNAVAAML